MSVHPAPSRPCVGVGAVARDGEVGLLGRRRRGGMGGFGDDCAVVFSVCVYLLSPLSPEPPNPT